MKKLSLIFIFAGVAFFSSCEKFDTPDALAGTTWKDAECTLVFTSTHATYTDAKHPGYNFTGAYTFDPPTVAIETSIPGELGGFVQNTGTIKKKTMTIGIHRTGDVVLVVDLKKQ